MKRLAYASLLLAAVAVGCGQPTPPAANAAAVELKPTTVAALDTFLASQKGKVVLIDCWSIT